MTNPTPLNPDALEAAAKSLDSNFNTYQYPVMAAMFRDYAETAVTAYLAVARPVVTGEQVNCAGWTCDGIHEPGSYSTCEDCRGACDDLANFYNQMMRTPNATGPWTYRPEES